MNYGYLAFMGLLCATLGLWGVVVLRDDTPPEQDSPPEEEPSPEEDQ